MIARSAAVFALVVAILSSASPAGAAEPSIAVDPGTGPPLTTIKVIGLGFCGPPCGPVSIIIGTLDVADGVTVGAGNSFTAFVQVPGVTRSGSNPVIAIQTASDGTTLSGRTTFGVTVSRPAPTYYPPPSSIQPPGGGIGVSTPPRPSPTSVAGTVPGVESTTATTTTPTTTSTVTQSGIAGTTLAPPTRQALAISDRRRSPSHGVAIAVALVATLSAGLAAVLWWRRRQLEP